MADVSTSGSSVSYHPIFRDHCDYQVPSNQRSLLSKLSNNPTLSKAAGLNDYAFHQQNLAQTSKARMTYRSVPKELFAQVSPLIFFQVSHVLFHQNEFELAALQDFQVPYFQPYKVQRKEFGTYNLAPIEVNLLSCLSIFIS